MNLDWRGRDRFVVLDTGFGSGLDFLSTWAAWRTDPHRPRQLHYVTTLAQPQAAADLLRHTTPRPDLQPLAQALAARWWGLLPGTHRLNLDSGQVLLTLGVGDTTAWLAGQRFLADAIHLAGPASPELAQALAHHARPGARITGAGAASDALAAAGFSNGVFTPAWAPHKPLPPRPQPGRVLVVGAGLAGASIAASLARRGCDVTVLDQGTEPASGASGLPAGLFGPHLSTDDAWLSQITRAGVRQTWQWLHDLPGLDGQWQANGILEHRVARGRHWPHADTAAGQDWTRAADATTLAQAGLPAEAPGWWHARAGWARPEALVRALLATPGVHFRGGVAPQRLQQASDGWHLLDAEGHTLEQAERVVLAAGPATRSLLPTALPLHALRGQVTGVLHGTATPALPPFATNGHGCLIPAVPTPQGPAWYCGSTFDRSRARPDTDPADDQANLDKLRELLPAVGGACADSVAAERLRPWAGVRCTVPDRVPLVGPVDEAQLPGLWVSTAMGARGLSLALLCGELAAAWWFHEPLPLDERLARHLRASRFVA